MSIVLQFQVATRERGDDAMLSVLLIDDDPVAAKVLEGFLSCRFGTAYDFVHAADLETGLAALERRRFDHVLLDNRLPPYRDYRDTLPALKRAAKDVAPILVSVSPSDACFEERAAFGSPELVDKFTLHERIRGGLFG